LKCSARYLLLPPYRPAIPIFPNAARTDSRMPLSNGCR
jgi:hypothetical protein